MAHRIFLASVILVWLPACTAIQGLPKSRATDPGAWRRAAASAFLDPDTWVPALGAGIVSTGNTDREISEWAVDRTPLFGSVSNADSASSTLKSGAHALMLLSRVYVARGSSWQHRAVQLLAQELMVVPTEVATDAIKDATNRDRPNGTDDRSFPSGHSSEASAYAALTRANLERWGVDQGWKRALSVGSRTLTVATAWARVEAGQHYPSDVLAGAALGNFLSSMLDEVFRGQDHVAYQMVPTPDGMMLQIAIRY